MLTAKQMARIKKYLGWEHKPDGAVEALIEIITEAVVQSADERHEAELAALGPF